MDLFKNIFNFCMIAGVIQGFVFLIYTSFSKRGRDKSMIYLNLLVLFLTLNNAQIPIIDNLFSSPNYFINNLHITFYVLTVPSFYAFLVHYLKVEKKIFDFFSIGLGLFILECVFRMVFYFNYFHKNESWFIAQYAQIEEITNATYSLFLFVKAALLVFNKQKMYTYVSSFDKIRWLKTFMILGGLVLLFWVLAIILNADSVLNPRIYIYYPLRLSSSILLYWIGYQGFRRYTMMSDRIEIRKVIEIENPIVEQIVSEKNKDKIFEKISEVEAYIYTTNCFLNPELTIKKMAFDLSISESTLSKIIKQGATLNFSDYVNKFRVEKAKEFLKDENYADYTLESIGLECGFNSKSTFYSAFKKFNEMTPSEFQKT